MNLNENCILLSLSLLFSEASAAANFPISVQCSSYDENYDVVQCNQGNPSDDIVAIHIRQTCASSFDHTHNDLVLAVPIPVIIEGA